jgi:dihydrofolate reductase
VPFGGRRKDVRIGGGARTIVQFLNAGLVEELDIALAPMFVGEGLRLFDGLDRSKVSVDVIGATHSPRVTHLRYAVRTK